MDQAGEVETLLQATSLLVHTTSPERATAILRSAIQRLAKPEAPDNFPYGAVNSRPTFTKTASVMRSWEPVRQRLQAEVEARGAGTGVIASEIGITLRQLQRAVSPKGRLPGAPTRTKIQRWLGRRDLGANAPPSRPRAAETKGAQNGPGANGAPARDRKPRHNGHPLPAYRLDVAARERLAAYLELNPMELRKTVGVTPELLSQAVAGKHDIAPEIVSRLASFLAAQTAIS
jgi:hypothetical protein